MKLKKVMSLFLALVMSFALAAPAFAAEPDDGDEGIMPLTQVYYDEDVSVPSGSPTSPFTTTPANGKYLRVWFSNRGKEAVTVDLRDYGTRKVLKSMTVPAGAGKALVYEIPTPDKPCTYDLYFQCLASGARVKGNVTVAQYIYNPAA